MSHIIFATYSFIFSYINNYTHFNISYTIYDYYCCSNVLNYFFICNFNIHFYSVFKLCHSKLFIQNMNIPEHFTGSYINVWLIGHTMSSGIGAVNGHSRTCEAVCNTCAAKQILLLQKTQLNTLLSILDYLLYT